MATLNLTLSPNPVAPGQTVTATYSIAGVPADEPASSRTILIDGTATLDGEELDADVTIVLNKPAVVHTQTFQAPTASGMTFVGTANPRVFTATAPAS